MFDTECLAVTHKSAFKIKAPEPYDTFYFETAATGCITVTVDIAPDDHAHVTRRVRAAVSSSTRSGASSIHNSHRRAARCQPASREPARAVSSNALSYTVVSSNVHSYTQW